MLERLEREQHDREQHAHVGAVLRDDLAREREQQDRDDERVDELPREEAAEPAPVHVAVVHAPDGTATIYWDGVAKATGNVPLPEPVPRSGLYIGHSYLGVVRHPQLVQQPQHRSAAEPWLWGSL